MWQLISFVADQFQVCFSTQTPFHHQGRGRNLLRAGISFLGRILHCRVSLMQLILQSIFNRSAAFFEVSVYNLQRWWQSKKSILSVQLFHPSSLLLHFSSTGINLIPLIFLPRITITLSPHPLLICMKNHRIT